jgi:oligosaccharide translocation protein RFT1
MDRPTELEDKPSSTQAELLSKSARGATFLIILQISSRALTFVVNQILLRYLSPELLGISTQLEVYSISVIFFARESLRVALQRQVDHGDEKLRLNTSTQRNAARTAAAKSQEIVNLAYISVFLGALLAPLLGWLYWRSIGANSYLLQAPCFKESLLLYGVAACLELLAEPCFAVVQQKSEYKIRASVESIATVSRCVVTCTSAIVASQKGVDIGVLPFAAGQIMYSLVLWSVYVWKVWPVAGANGFSLFVSPIRSEYSNPSPPP